MSSTAPSDSGSMAPEETIPTFDWQSAGEFEDIRFETFEAAYLTFQT